jgi:diacylglycerol O-acyltransferase / wax synthase
MIDRPARTAGSRLARLTAIDRMFLRDESADWPCHFGGLAVVEGAALLDDAGEVRVGEITDRLNRRLARVPELRRRLCLPGPLRGGPLWVDDPQFAIGRHVHQAQVAAPGGDAELLDAAARLYAGLLDRGRPLWELWFLTGLSEGRVGVLLKLHHAVADGTAAVALMGSLFDVGPDAPDPISAAWLPDPMPSGWSLLADNLASKVKAVGRAIATLAHPRRVARGVRVFVQVARRLVGQKPAPQTSLNQVVRAGRRVRFLRLNLAGIKEAAHARGGKVNDVVLDLWSGGLRQLLVSRGERVAGLELIAALAVSMRSTPVAGTIDNRAGTVVLPLPVGEADARHRLDLIVRATRKTKASQLPAAIMAVIAGLSATPIGRYFNVHQRATNVIVTNVAGPPVPMYVLGARILEVLPIIQLVGNIGLTLCAFSYAGQLSLVVTADADGFPDLDVLMDAMEREWQALNGCRIADVVPGTSGASLRSQPIPDSRPQHLLSETAHDSGAGRRSPKEEDRRPQPSSTCRDCTRQLEGATHRAHRAGCRGGTGAPRRDPGHAPAHSAGHDQLPGESRGPCGRPSCCQLLQRSERRSRAPLSSARRANS